MKKIIITLALAAIATSAFAQMSVGGGYLSSTMKANKTSSVSDGFYAGFDYNLPLGVTGLGVAPGLYYSYLTNSSSAGLAGIATVKGTLKEHYVSVPVNFNYGLNLVDGALKVSLYAGPTFNLGLASKTVYDANTLVGDSSSETDHYADKNYKRFDLLIGGGVALDIVDMIRVNFGYNYGLLDRDATDSGTLKRAGWHVGLAYLF